MRGFLLAAQAGPTASSPFAVAKEYLTADAALSWLPMAGATMLDGVPHLELTADEANNLTQVQVEAIGRAVAQVNANGEYVEFDTPESVSLHFTMQQVDGNWRISELADGIVLPAQVFTATYQPTRIYRPSADGRYWVPEVRWFPQATWRTNAVQALFAGPPLWLADAVLPAAPENAALQLEDVELAAGGEYLVRVQGYVRDASEETRALLRAQIAATLLGEPENPRVTLVDALGAIPVPEMELPISARTQGSARVLVDGQLLQVRGRELVASAVGWQIPENPTALAVGQDYSQTVVWRLGRSEIVLSARDDAGDPVFIPLFSGRSVIPPSIDVYGYIWTGEAHGGLKAVSPGGMVTEVSAAWVADYSVEQIRVSPEGSRAVLLTRDANGTRIFIAGVIRDAAGTPIGLAEPMQVGASLLNVAAVSWHDDTTLAAIGTAAAVRGVYLVGIGGLDSFGGLPRHIPGLNNPAWLTASVGTGNILGIDAEGKLHLREAMSLWPLVGTGQVVDLVAYPG